MSKPDADTIISPIMAPTRVFFALSACCGFPAEVIYITPDIIIMIMMIAPVKESRSVRTLFPMQTMSLIPQFLVVSDKLQLPYIGPSIPAKHLVGRSENIFNRGKRARDFFV